MAILHNTGCCHGAVIDNVLFSSEIEIHELSVKVMKSHTHTLLGNVIRN